VVGGSLTGPVVALLLIQAGFDRVTVYEAASATASQGGGLISLEHAALDILDRLSIPQHEFVTYDSENIVQITVRDHHRVRRLEDRRPTHRVTARPEPSRPRHRSPGRQQQRGETKAHRRLLRLARR